jgi:putative ABC transport system permease protein
VRDAIPPTIYRPFDQVIDETERALPSVSISVRAAPGIPPLRLDAGVAAAIAAVNPDLKVSFRSLSVYLHAYYIRERLLALMCGFFGALALLLTAVGVFGVTAYSVNERRSEPALRLALGATRWTIGALVGRRVCIASAAGLLAGSAAAWWGMRFVGSLLFGIDGHDPLTFAAAASSIALVMAVATWLPARRAGRANLARVLREV